MRLMQLLGWVLYTRRFARDRRLFRRDEAARVVHPGGDLGAIISDWRGRHLPYKDWPINHDKAQR
jgi:hypothetical protein